MFGHNLNALALCKLKKTTRRGKKTIHEKCLTNYLPHVCFADFADDVISAGQRLKKERKKNEIIDDLDRCPFNAYLQHV